MVGTWCMCCVYKSKLIRKQDYRRFDEDQFTEVSCKTNMSKQCIIVGYWGRNALDDDRSGGRVYGMEWCGLGWVGVRVGVGVWGGGGARGEGEGSDHRSIFDCSTMITVLFVHCAKQMCFVQAYYRPFVD